MTGLLVIMEMTKRAIDLGFLPMPTTEDTIPSLAEVMTEIRRLRARVLELENAILDLVNTVTQPQQPPHDD